MKRVVHHALGHLLVHLGLFAGFAVLVPVISTAIETSAKPWTVQPAVFSAGAMLIVLSAFLMYRTKESVANMLKSVGTTLFIPGALAVLSSVFDFKDFFSSTSKISGFAVIQPATEWYFQHSVPTILSVAAVYLSIGGTLYWVGTKMEKISDKFSFSNQ